MQVRKHSCVLRPSYKLHCNTFFTKRLSYTLRVVLKNYLSKSLLYFGVKGQIVNYKLFYCDLDRYCYSQRMPRPLRLEFPGACYHVMARGNARQAIALDDRDRRRFVAVLERTVDKYGVVIHAFALMGNHYHLLIETPEPCLSLSLKFLNSSYVAYFNRRHNHVGHLFQGRFKSILVGDDHYFLHLADYIHLNPVRAKMVDQPDNYQWTSYNHYVRQRQAFPFVFRERVLALVGKGRANLQACYRKHVAKVLGNETAFLADLRHGFILGSDAFVGQLQRLLKGQDGVVSLSQTKQLVNAGVVERVSQLVADHFGVDSQSLWAARRGRGQRNVPRDVAMHVLYRSSRLSNRAIGARFGVSYAAVKMASNRVENNLKTDIELTKLVGSIVKSL